MNVWKYLSRCLFVAIAVVLFVFLQKEYAYHFFFIEQNYLFQNTWQYVGQQLLAPGGLATLSGEFLVQYFMYPYCGAVITTVLLSLVALVTYQILKRINSGLDWTITAWFPALCLLFIHFDFNYMPAGTIAFLFLLLGVWGALLIRHDYLRLAYHLVVIGGLFWLFGSVFALYILLVVLYELINGTRLRFISFAFLPIGFLMGWALLHFAIVGEWRFVFLPDVFYHNNLFPKPNIYYSWILLVLLFVMALKLKLRGEKPVLGRILELVFPLVAIAFFSFWGIHEYGDEKAQKVKELDYFVRTENWDKVIDECSGTLTNYLYICYLNMSLAEKGWLAERMFQFDQRGVDGLLLKWNRTFSVSVMLSDIYYTIGHIAVAQEMGFEAYVSAMGGGSPRMLKRLIETNLIYGEYPVAEKYIDLLEKTVYYKDWATAHRRFLYNDQAVEADPLLGGKRKGLVQQNYLSNTFGIDHDLIKMAEQYPTNKNAIEYLGGLLLLSKDMKGFQELLDTYYGTDILPVLPLGFQEAVIILSENAPEQWLKYHLSNAVIERFGQFKKTILANKNNRSLPQIVGQHYANTYWFYFMFK